MRIIKLIHELLNKRSIGTERLDVLRQSSRIELLTVNNCNVYLNMVEIEQMIFIVLERLSHSVHVIHNEPNIYQ